MTAVNHLAYNTFSTNRSRACQLNNRHEVHVDALMLSGFRYSTAVLENKTTSPITRGERTALSVGDNTPVNGNVCSDGALVTAGGNVAITNRDNLLCVRFAIPPSLTAIRLHTFRRRYCLLATESSLREFSSQLEECLQKWSVNANNKGLQRLLHGQRATGAAYSEHTVNMKPTEVR